MDAFAQELLQRSKLACTVLELFDFAFDDRLLQGLYDDHRGRSYTDELTFDATLRLVRDALLQHQGSAHKLFVELQRDGREPVDESNFYRKLARMPVAVSRALLRQCSVRLREVSLPATLLPGCFEPLAVVVIDGKKIKRAAHRLKPTRGYGGKLLGAKALVAMDARSGLALAMSDSLDGEANELPLTGELLPQVRAVIVDQPVLWLADRQFCDAATLGMLSVRDGDHFVVRVRKGLCFQAESTRTHLDEQGRQILEQVGLFGSGKRALRCRVTLLRPGEEDVVLITDLLDTKQFDAPDLLKLYKKRWGVEQMFQQVTETFALEHLIGCAPRAILFQFALCLLMYNLIQIVKGYVVEDGAVEVSIVSTYGLFYDIKRELGAWAYFGAGGDLGDWPRRRRDDQPMRRRLRELLKGSWDPVAYTKASDKKPRRKKPPPRRLAGGHTSVQRLLQTEATVIQ